jgi:hypothetical protein
LEDRFRHAPWRPGFWLLRPFGRLPLVLEFSDAARQRYLDRLRRWRLLGLWIGAPLAWLVWRMAGDVALGVVILFCVAVMVWTWREAWRVPASAWPDDPAADAAAAIRLTWVEKALTVFGMALLLLFAVGLAMTLRNGTRWEVLLVPLGMMTITAVQVVTGLRKWRASIRAARPPQS